MCTNQPKFLTQFSAISMEAYSSKTIPSSSKETWNEAKEKRKIEFLKITYLGVFETSRNNKIESPQVKSIKRTSNPLVIKNKEFKPMIRPSK